MKLKDYFAIFAMGCLMSTGFTACDDDDDNGNEESIEFYTPQVISIEADQATVTCDVDIDEDDMEKGETRVIAYGFCYGTSQNPSIHDATVKVMPQNGKMEAVLTELENNQLYRVRAFATLYPEGVIYSPVTEIAAGNYPPAK